MMKIVISEKCFGRWPQLELGGFKQVGLNLIGFYNYAVIC